MKLTIKYRIYPTDEQENILKQLGFYATKLYNTDNYQRREVWEETGKIPSWYDQKKKLKDNHWYKLLPSQTAQAVIKNLQDNYNSWFSLRKKDPKARPPMFRKKDHLSPLVFYQQFSMFESELFLSMSMKFRKEIGVSRLQLKFQKWKEIVGKPKMCSILYKKGKWMAHIIYEVPEPPIIPDDEVLAVDVGIINLAATVDTYGNTSLYSGRQILAVQYYFNKTIAKIQSQTMKQYGKKSSKTINKLHEKKWLQINQIIHTTTKTIIENAKQINIGIIVCGDIKHIRKDKNWGKKSNQKLHAWPFDKFLTQLEYKAKLSGIRLIKVSERYTSQTCSVCGIKRKSSRKFRGLYICQNCGTTINADINGATNILKKYLQEGHSSKSIGHVDYPLTYRVSEVLPCSV